MDHAQIQLQQSINESQGRSDTSADSDLAVRLRLNTLAHWTYTGHIERLLCRPGRKL
jgi:hypothetical protein